MKKEKQQEMRQLGEKLGRSVKWLESHHWCGLQGFGQKVTDVCPLCEKQQGIADRGNDDRKE